MKRLRGVFDLTVAQQRVIIVLLLLYVAYVLYVVYGRGSVPQPSPSPGILP